MPEGKPAPPRPRRPEALISDMIFSETCQQLDQKANPRMYYPVMALQYDFLCLVPIAILLRALQVCTVVAIQILEYPILVFQSSEVCPLRRRRILNSC